MAKRTTSLDLFSPEQLPLRWHPPNDGTFFSIQSKAPSDFIVRCVTEDGHMAHPDKATTINGTVHPAGSSYQAEFLPGGRVVKSPLYSSLDEAKNACSTYRREGAFPEKQKGS